MARESVRMAHVVCGVVNDIDIGETHDAHDEEAQHHCHQRLGKPTNLAGRDRQMRDLGLSHRCSPRLIWLDSSNIRAMSRLVR